MRRILGLLLCFVGAAAILLGGWRLKHHFDRVARMTGAPPLETSHYTRRVAEFTTMKSRPRIVMLGDSRIEQANWTDLLGRSDVENRGISGDTTSGVLARLEQSVPPDVQVCAIQIGVNDLFQQSPPAVVEQNCREIVARLTSREAFPHLILMAIILTSEQNGTMLNAQIRETNAGLRGLAQEKRIGWFDPNEFLSPGSVLERRWTPDGVHLNADGYAELASKLKAEIEAALERPMADRED